MTNFNAGGGIELASTASSVLPGNALDAAAGVMEIPPHDVGCARDAGR